MAPRGRSKKKANTRKDAAIDAMKPYGFHINLVKTTIKELLDVYGEDGWPFIEDSAYKVLLEAILEKVVKETGEGTSCSKNPVAETAGSETALESACSTVNPVTIESQISNGLDSAPEANEALCTPQLTNESDGKSLPPVAVNAEGSAKSNDQDPCTSSHFIPLPTHDPPPVQVSNSTAKRRPYYGWKHSDDEEDLVELTPGPIAEENESYLRSFMEHKKRWDIKP
ncbi:hypothetical protein V6N12_019520 [Hibiscus sabdariffa]|uniref:WIYLD domain-containing protein n=1 Tax=Hibiscus sabdariffa TaxID=183260 RepID=A0ABR2BMG7_9ROSI